MRNNRYCIPVKSEYKGQVQGMVHDQSSTGSTFFIEPAAVVNLNNELRELEIKEQEEAGLASSAISSSDRMHRRISLESGVKGSRLSKYSSRGIENYHE